MSLPQEFFSSLPTRKTEELVDALARAGDYEPAAIEAFQDELRRRGLEPVSLAEQVEARKAVAAPIDKRASEPLEWPLRILCLFILGPLFLVILFSNYRKQGYDRKSRELLEWTCYGFGVTCLLCLLGRVIEYFS
jgi:hypothetical protein